MSDLTVPSLPQLDSNPTHTTTATTATSPNNTNMTMSLQDPAIPTITEVIAENNHNNDVSMEPPASSEAHGDSSIPSLQAESSPSVSQPMPPPHIPSPMAAPIPAPSPTVAGAATSLPAAASASSTSTSTSSASSVLKQNMKLNQYFKLHNITHSDQARKIYLDYIRNHNGEEPPASLFSAPTTTATTPSLQDPNVVLPIPPPSSAALAPSGSGANTTTDSTAQPSTSSSSTAPVSASASVPGPPTVPPVATRKNIDLVRSIIRVAYSLTHDERSIRQHRVAEVQHTLNSLKGGSGGMSQLQATLMGASEQTLSRLQQQQQLHQQAMARNQATPASGSHSNGQVAPIAANTGFDPRRPNPNSNPMVPSPTNNPQLQQQAYKAQVAKQQRGAKRKDPPVPVPSGAPFSGPVPGAVVQSAIVPKFRKEAIDTSAPEIRTQRALELQGQALGTPAMNPNIITPPGAQPPQSAAPKRPTASGQSTNLSSPSSSTPSTAANMTQAAQSPAPPAAPPVPQISKAQASKASLTSQWTQTKQPLADKDNLYLDPTTLINKLSSVAEGHGLCVQVGDAGLASVELLMLATEGFLKTILQSARHLSRRRQDVSKSYLPIQITSEPRKELDEIQRSIEDRKLRWSKHRERASFDETKRKDVTQDAISKNSNDTLERAPMSLPSDGAGLASGGQDDLLAMLDSSLGGIIPMVSGTTSSSSAPTTAAPSFLPPSSHQPKSFLPSSTLSSSSISTPPSHPTITLVDLLAAMEAHPRMRKSSRLYRSLSLLGDKSAALRPKPAPTPTPPPAVTPSPTPSTTASGASATPAAANSTSIATANDNLSSSPAIGTAPVANSVPSTLPVPMSDDGILPALPSSDPIPMSSPSTSLDDPNAWSRKILDPTPSLSPSITGFTHPPPVTNLNPLNFNPAGLGFMPGMNGMPRM